MIKLELTAEEADKLLNLIIPTMPEIAQRLTEAVAAERFRVVNDKTQSRLDQI